MIRWLLAVALLMTVATPATAQTAPRKALRGLAAVTTPFLEIPGNMVAETRQHGAGEGIPVGFAKGLGKIVPRVLVGVWEILSAPFPVPANYRSLLRPEFPWGYFDGDSAHKPHRHRGA